MLLAYTKIALFEELLASTCPDDPYVAGELERYFPPPLRERFGDADRAHPLRREIIATAVINDLVNRAGTTFAFRLGEETGAAPADIARAFIVAREVFDLRGLWAEIEALDGQVPAATQIEMLLEARVLLERATRWLLRNRPRPLDIAATISRFAPGGAALAAACRCCSARPRGARKRGRGASSRAFRRRSRDGSDTWSPSSPSLDLVEVAGPAEWTRPSLASRISRSAGGSSCTGCASASRLPREARWEAMARVALRDDAYAEQAALTAEVVSGPIRTAPIRRSGSTGAWRENGVRSRALPASVRRTSERGAPPDLARLSVALREIRNLIHSSGIPSPAAQPH